MVRASSSEERLCSHEKPKTKALRSFRKLPENKAFISLKRKLTVCQWDSCCEGRGEFCQEAGHLSALPRVHCLVTSINCTPTRSDPSSFGTLERTNRCVQKCPDLHLHLLILKSPTLHEVLIYSVSEILLWDSYEIGQFLIPCDEPRDIRYRQAPSLTNCTKLIMHGILA